jgi:hypothetical protein
MEVFIVDDEPAVRTALERALDAGVNARSFGQGFPRVPPSRSGRS